MGVLDYIGGGIFALACLAAVVAILTDIKWK